MPAGIVGGQERIKRSKEQEAASKKGGDMKKAMKKVEKKKTKKKGKK